MKTSTLVIVCGLLGAVGGFAQTAPVRTTPKPIAPTLPAYPAALTDTGKNGAATIDVLVKADGTVADPLIKSADDEAFAAAAIATVTTWHFEPGTLDNVPADMRVAIPFKFAAPPEQQLNVRFKRKVFQSITEPVMEARDYGRKLKLKNDVDPVYPRALLKSRVTEKVEVAFVVAPDGTTLNPTIVGRHRKEFVMAALTAVVRSTYQPLVKDGKGVYVSTSRTFKIEPPVRRSRGGEGGDFGGDPGGGGGGNPEPGGG